MPISVTRREYLRNYQRKWVADRRRKGIELLGGKCAECGSVRNLELDHIDPATKGPAASVSAYGVFLVKIVGMD